MMNIHFSVVLFIIFSLYQSIAIAETTKAENFSSFECKAINQRAASLGINKILDIPDKNENSIYAVTNSNDSTIVENYFSLRCTSTPCKAYLPWILAQSPNYIVQNYALKVQMQTAKEHLFEAGYIAYPSEVFKDVYSEIEDFIHLTIKSDYGITSPKAISRLNEITAGHENKENEGTKKITKFSPLICADVTSLKCAQGVRMAFQIIQPTFLTQANFHEKIYGIPTFVYFPDSIHRIFSSELYAKVLNRLLLQMTAKLRNAPTLHNVDATFIDDLESSIASVVPGITNRSKNIIARDILAFYGSKGINTDSLYPYFYDSHYGIIAKFTLMGALINMLDTQKIFYRKSSYALPGNFSNNLCFIGKPYHFWFGYALTADLLEYINEPKYAALSTHMIEIFYEFLGPTQPREGLLITKVPYSTHNQSIKLNILLNDFGSIYAIQKKENKFSTVDFSQNYYDFSFHTQSINQDLYNIKCGTGTDCMASNFFKLAKMYSQWKKSVMPHYLVELFDQ